MEASTVGPPPIPSPQFQPNPDKIKRRLLKHGVNPTPKIMHNLTKKEIQKHNRKLNKLAKQNPQSSSQSQTLTDEESHFLTLRREYKEFNKAINGGSMVGKPWEKIESVELKELAIASEEGREFVGDKLKRENLKALRDCFERDLKWVLEDDIDIQDGGGGDLLGKSEKPIRRERPEADVVRYLVERLSNIEVTVRDWKIGSMMKQSELEFTEKQLLKIVDMLAYKGCWRQALAVVDWAYGSREHKHFKSRFVYTKLLSIIGKARRPQEALRIFNLMLGDYNLYPDMAAYHSIAVTLGQAGLLEELIKIIDYMRQKPSKRVKNVYYKKWSPVLEPDLVVYNAVLNACVPSRQWKGVSWVFEQLKNNALTPNGPTYGLAMEVMLQSGKFDLVHSIFEQMKRKGEAPKALTYRVLVKTFVEEGKINKAVEAVREMEQKGVVGAASVYYELACCLCKNGRWQDAMVEVEKIKKLPHAKPLEVTFTGMIQSSMDGGHIDDCISIFQRMKDHCIPNIGTINAMLKIYGQQDLFSNAKDLFEEMKRTDSAPCSSSNGDTTYVVPDEYTYSIMLEASASALQWEYFDHVYKEMTLSAFQIDQSKYASLLVKACRAGKGYLLEHAFHAILEAGEIPNQMLYTEMVLEAAVQNNYERASTLINSMAHASFRVSEKQWALVFEKNGDRISQETLEQLLDALGNCDVKSEATISNLSKTLHSLCRFGKEGDLSSSTDHCRETTDLSYMNESEVVGPRSYARTVVENPSMDSGDEVELSGDLSCDDDREDQIEVDTVSKSSKTVIATLFYDDDDEEDGDFTELAYGGLIPGLDGDDDEDGIKPNLPSAHGILETWKESRHKDGIYLPFQRSKSESK